jgi:hypothetical protein
VEGPRGIERAGWNTAFQHPLPDCETQSKQQSSFGGMPKSVVGVDKQYTQMKGK